MTPRKFDGVPTEPLFDALVERPRTRERVKAARRVALLNCPRCTREAVAVVRQGDHYVWRLHYYLTWSGSHFVCASSGVALCVVPEAKPYREATTLHCPHTVDKAGDK